MSSTSPITGTEEVPEPIGLLTPFGIFDRRPVLVYECPICCSLTTTLPHILCAAPADPRDLHPRNEDL